MSTYRHITPISTHHDYYNCSITALTFDTVSDTLWTGNSLGYIVAYYGTQGNRGVKFPVGGDLPVKKIISGDQYVRALGTTGHGVGNWSKGGVNKWYFQPKSNHVVTTFSNTVSATSNIAVATSAPELMLVNSSTGSIVRHSPSISVATHILSSHSQLVVGFSDGWIRTYDGRSSRFGEHSEASVKAHLKGIQGLEVSGNYAFTIGYGLRQGRPFSDPLVKVYDLRKLQPLAPVSFPSGPGFINTLPRRSSSIVVTSTTGLVTIVDASNPTDVGEFYQLDIASYVSSVAVSATGVYLAFGDGDGNIHLMSAAEEDGRVPFNGFDGQPIEWADVPEPLPEIEWTENTPLNSIGMPFYDTPLLSSWTPQFLPPSLYYPPAAKIPPQVLNSMKVNEFVGYAALPKELQGRRNVVPTAPREVQGRFRSGKARKELPEPTTPISEYNLQDIPKAYRKVEIEYSKFGVEDFDFAFYNRTEYSGLETHIMNSYTNALVQTLHYVEPVRRLATSHITTNCTNEHCLLCELGFVSRMLSDARGTNCQASNFCRTVGALAQSANSISLIDFGRPDTDYSHMIQAFHRFLLDQLCSEGNAFPHNPRVVPVKLGSSSTDSLAAAPITQLLGIIAKNVIKCSNCAAVREKENMTHVVDLVYPRKSLQPGLPNTDFAMVLRNSLIREMTHKATCQSCKHFSTFESRRNIPSRDLPPVLAVNASAYNEENIKIWCDRSPKQTFLQPTVEIRGQVGGVDDMEIVQYELRSIVVQVTPRERAASPHLVSIVKVRDAEQRPELKSPWFVFNDFVVTNVDEHDALSFPESWKTPSILYFERVDVVDRLDYSELPLTMDTTILQSDVQHFLNNRDPSAIKHEPLDSDELPTLGMLVAIDAEFVSMQQEETEFKSDGTKKVLRPARLSLARVSVLRGDGPKQGVPFIDDHIHTSEIVVDYLTEFSGIKPGDLDPVLSRHTLVPLKVAYKKLRVLVDSGCIFIGHGLAKDFRIINIFVPPEQVIDTVDVYHLQARQRKLSLRFLSWAILKQHIQTDTHDSIEDARSALLLYKMFQEYEEQGIFDEKLEELYRIGKQYNWKPPAPPGAQQSPPLQPQQQTMLPAQLQYLVSKPNLLTAFMLSPQAHNTLIQQQQRQYIDDLQLQSHSRSMSPRGSSKRAMSPPQGSIGSFQQSWRRGQR